MTYYNEIDAHKAACLREFIKADLIAPGEVDERSIADLDPSDLRGFTQCHFFAGFGVWSYALRLAGWPDDRPVWTGSCPCPSFSAAGKGGGFRDARHLWPAWSRLIGECRPATIFGEQADDAIGYGWLDLVQTDLERADYAVGKAVLGACSVGAPHIRQRLYFGAHANRSAGIGSESRAIERTGIARSDTRAGLSPNSHGRLPGHRDLQRSGEQRLLAEDSGTGERSDSLYAGSPSEQDRGQNKRARANDSTGTRGHAGNGSDSPQRGQSMHGSAPGNGGHAAQPNESLISADSAGLFVEQFAREGTRPGEAERGRSCGEPSRYGDTLRPWRGPGWLDPLTARSVAAAGATRGFWADCDWWHARDEKYRPIEPGLFPLAHGAANRVLKLRGYGDAIIPQVAAEFIRCCDYAMRLLEAKQEDL